MTCDSTTLQPFGDEHVARTFEWVSDPWLQKNFLMRRRPTWEMHQAYFHRILSDPSQNIYAILNNGVHVGNCGIKNICAASRSAELWIYIGANEHRGKHVGTQATQLLCREAFDVRGLTSLCVHVADFNEVAQKMYEKLGFVTPSLNGSPTPEWQGRSCGIRYMELRRS
ncbi:MAG: GNAT family N-acetyltransferase [Syntrophorhabdales bacterium]